MPQLSAIDMRAQSLPSNRWISSVLEDAIAERITKGEQSLLFLNRRGYAPITLCRACGEQIGCQNCDARLVEHRFQKRLMCHQCGDSWPIPRSCPSCGKADSMAVVGPGVERLAEEAKSLFPEVNVVTLSSDMFSSRAMKRQIQSVAAGEGEIIVGTQLVAKGHNFPNLTLVGVIDTISVCRVVIFGPLSAPFNLSVRSQDAQGGWKNRGLHLSRHISRIIL